nr:copia protein [Tanacetum cinerariifolium]
MQEELNQFVANDIWELVPQPKNMTIIGTKWVFRNKLDENDIVSQNKARLVAQGYNQQEGIDYDETYGLIARLKSIRILLAYAYALDFKLFQMDVKSAFLNGFINEKVYMEQPSGFIDFEKPDHVYKLKKALYGLKQAPKAWGFGHFARDCTVRPRRRDAAYLQTQLLIDQKEEAGIQLQAEEYDLMAAAADLGEIEKVNANCILMANLQQASSLGTQTDITPVYDTDGSAEVHENYDNNEIFNMFTQEEQYTELL